MTDLWTALLDILILLAAAMVLGGVCERLRQSPILGYLLAGTLLGPNALDLLPSHAAVASIAELGVALLLFTIGLEFSWRRLRSVGSIAAGGGTLQVVVTGTLAALVCLAIGLDVRAAVAVGAMIPLSSTAAVVRLLAGRAEIDAVHGRNALGILLLQDIAVVPLILLIAVLGGEGSAVAISLALARAVGLAVVLAAAFHVLLNRVVPLLLSTRVAARNRDLPILLAVVTAVGAAWISHALGFTPILGAFLAGILLAESPFAAQIRADIVPFQTLFLTLFFSSIGMLTNPAWATENWLLLAAVVLAIVLGKTAVTAGAAWLLGTPPAQALATGLVLAQVGEFALVIAGVAQEQQVIGREVFELTVAALTITLFVTPYLTALAPRVTTLVGTRLGATVIPSHETGGHGETMGRHLVIIGFGPAGQRVAELLMGVPDLPILVVDMNPATATHAQAYGLPTRVGDAMREEVLESLHVRTASAVVITVPDPRTARQIVLRVRALSPTAMIVVRARYHIHRWQLDVAGADVVVDEENEVGIRIASEVRNRMMIADS